MKSELFDHIGTKTLKKSIKSDPNYQRLLRTLCLFGVMLTYFIIYELSSAATVGLKYVFPQTRLNYKKVFATGFWMLCIYMLELNNVQILITGDKLEPENALIMSNHLSLVDYIIFPYLILRSIDDPNKDYSTKTDWNKPEKIFSQDISSIIFPKVKFFTWFAIWDIPSFKLFKHVFTADENWELNDETLHFIFKNLIESEDTEWLVTFPEVNIFTEKDSRMQQGMNEKFYLPTFNNLLYPRYPSFANAINGLYKTHFTRLYDISIIYYRKPHRGEPSTKEEKEKENIKEFEEISFTAPNLFEIFGLYRGTFIIRVHIKAKMMSTIPLKRNRLDKWLEGKWIKKDKLITKLKNEIQKEERKNFDTIS